MTNQSKNIEITYKNRFENIAERNLVWKILVKNFFQKYINKNDVVLDLPCGYCEFINNVKCKTKIGVDRNPDSKKHAASNVKIIQSYSSDLSKIKNSTIDKIFISNFFEHITWDEIHLTIKELSRVLRKGGKILLLQPNIRFCLKDFWMFTDHITPIDDRAIEEIFDSYDFQLEKKILKFLPYTMKTSLPIKSFFLKIYLKIPLLWKMFGKQSFFIFIKN